VSCEKYTAVLGVVTWGY